MADPIDRRSFLARGAVAGAGVALAGAAGGMLAGCGSSSSSSGSGASGTGSHPNGISSAKPKTGGSLIVGTEAEEKGFSTTLGTFDETGVLYARTVFDPLMILDANGTPQPYLAQSVTANADYTQWTITLRPNVLFHNGTPCDANALRTNFQLFKQSALTGPAITTIQGVNVTGPLTVTIDMSSPWVPFDYYLTGGIGGQIAYVSEPNWLATQSQTNPIGTGPFVFQSWTPNDHFTATKNPHYWRPGLPYLDSITYKPIPDSTQLYQSLASGAVDIINSSSSEVHGPLLSNTSYGLVTDATHIAGEPDMDCMLLNLSTPPFNNLKARQAAAMALSSAEYVKVINQNLNPTSNGPFAKGSPYWLADNSYPTPDPTKATQLVKELQQSGQSVTLTLGQTPDPSTTKIAEFVQSQWNNVGFKVSLQPVQQADIINDALLGKFQALTWRQFGAVNPDMNYIFWSPTQITPSFSIDMSRNTDPAMQAALLKGRQSTSKADQIAAYQQVNRLMGKDIPYVWAGQTVWCCGASPKVQNFNNPTTPGGKPAFGFITGAIWPTQIWLD